MKHVIGEGFEGFLGWQPVAGTVINNIQELLANYIQNVGNKNLRYLKGAARIHRTVIFPTDQVYTQSKVSATEFTGAVWAASGQAGTSFEYLPPVPIDDDNGLQFAWAKNQFPTSFSEVIVKLSDGTKRSFGQSPDAGVGFFGLDNANNPIALIGNNSNNTAGVGWQKMHYSVYKTAGNLKVSLATSRDVANVLTYTEAIGAVTITSIEFCAPIATGGINPARVDDVNVWEIEPADIAAQDAGFGTFAIYNKFIKQFAQFYTGVNSAEEHNGDVDDWTSVGENHAELTDGDRFTLVGATPNQHGFLQLRTFEQQAFDIPGQITGPVTLKNIGFWLFAIADDDGELMTQKTKNAANEVDLTQNTQAGEFGCLNQWFSLDVNWAGIGSPTKTTNGMIVTAKRG